MREVPRGPSREETLKEVLSGTASPTPEFVVEGLAKRPEEASKEEHEAHEMLGSLKKEVEGMNASEVDAFISGLKNLKPHLESEEINAAAVFEQAQSKPLARAGEMLNALLQRESYTFSPREVRDAAAQRGEKEAKVDMINDLLDAAVERKESLEKK